MSSRSIRRLQGKDPLATQNSECSEGEDERIANSGGGARRKVLPSNLFGLLSDDKESSDEKEEEKEEKQLFSDDRVSGCKKKKKKKTYERKYKTNEIGVQVESEIGELEFLETPEVQHNSSLSSSALNIASLTEGQSSLLGIKVNNLNMNYELKKIFGSSIIENTNNRRRSGKPQMKNFRLVNPRENWPPIYKSGISMKMEKTGCISYFTFVHSLDYQKIQHMFLDAVDTLNPENIIAILNAHPYHVDALLQLSDLCKLSEDLQVAAELNERALYCLENALHHQFNIARGNCRLDYRYQVNRPFFICLFKHLTFVGERACYKTALELCKLLLLLDFESDPLAVVLCIDFYALRSLNYAWLIQVADEWESKKNLSQLPNFAFSTALARFYLTEAGESNDLSEADRLLQDALILFPGVLKLLLDKCNIQYDRDVAQHPFFSTVSYQTQSNALKVLTTLYVNRTYHEWKNREVLPWMEKNVRCVLQRVDSLDPIVEECARRRQTRYTGSPSNVLRHIILSDMKDVMSTVNGINSSFLSFDPIPPLDSINIYYQKPNARVDDLSPSLSLFFRSILPSFNLHRQQGNQRMANNAVAENDFNGQASAFQDTLQHSVTMIMDAVALLLTNIHVRGRELEDGAEQGNANEETYNGPLEGRANQNSFSRPDNHHNTFTDSSSENGDESGC